MQAKGQAVDAGSVVRRQLFPIHGAGVALHGDLRPFPQCKCPGQRLQQPGHGLAGQEGGRAAPDEQGFIALARKEPARQADLLEQGLQVFCRGFLARERQEVAIGALPYAKGDMHIEPSHIN